jgi:dihydroflavonol-4-reductase
VVQVRALVIGGTGFIGGCIADMLRRKDYEVCVTVRSKDAPELKNPSSDPQLKFLYGNVLDPDSIRGCLRGSDLVFGCFGLLGKWGLSDRDYWQTNVVGVANLLKAISEAGIRQFIHLSSAGVLGPLADGVIADESHRFNPSNIYETTKCEAEKEVHRYAGEHRIPFTIVRPEFVYGPGDMHVFGLFRAIQRKRFPLIGSGKSLLHPTYIDDLVQGILLCAGNQNAYGKTYLITGDRSVSVKHLGTTIARALNVPLLPVRLPKPVALAMAGICESLARILNHREPVLTRARVKFFSENRAFSNARAHRELGYVPRMGLDEGVRRTVSFYREKGLL